MNYLNGHPADSPQFLVCTSAKVCTNYSLCTTFSHHLAPELLGHSATGETTTNSSRTWSATMSTRTRRSPRGRRNLTINLSNTNIKLTTTTIRNKITSIRREGETVNNVQGDPCHPLQGYFGFGDCAVTFCQFVRNHRP